jgi:pilus assembly protein Flp/PilA
MLIHTLMYLQAWLRQAIDDERGATMVEYGLMVVLVALVAAVGATLLGGALSGLFSDVAGDL